MRQHHRRCPIRGCGSSVQSGQLMCRRHWHTVPRPLRDAVWSAYRSGVGSPEHIRAVRNALTAAQDAASESEAAE